MKKKFFYLFLILMFVRCSDSGTDIPVAGYRDLSVDTNKRELQNKMYRGRSAGRPTLTQEPRHPGIRLRSGVKRKRTKNDTTLNFALKAAEDSARLNRITTMRKIDRQIDLNEPISREQISGRLHNPDYSSMVMLSDEVFLEFSFDNDILDYTDRFYTNGIRVELIHPGLRSNPLAVTMIPYWSSATNYYGLAVVQNMYTPSTTKTGGIKIGDRPYAAYLYFSTKKITNDPVHRFRQTTGLDVGIIGPNSYGEWVQRAFHTSVPTNNEPLGWEYQIQNDLVLNYNLAYEKGIVSASHFEVNLQAVGQIGTLYTNTSGGIGLRAGWINPYFANLGVEKGRILRGKGLKKNQFFVFLRGSGKLVGYDATLQGGLFNKSSAYVISRDEICRFVFQTSAGLSLTLGGVRLDIEQFLLSPEFSGGLWHKWVHIALVFCL
ncbi:MAG: lipid A deacylase LpxR family protein [Alphaproteobacteria bacterium]|nr:lipid A deacylase LpxR family protein [Alphaproteobacteria bacterium]